MKTINSVVIGMVLSGLSAMSSASADELSTLPHWVNDSQKTVYFAPRPQLKITVSNLGADEAYWDQLDIELSYENASYEQQTAALKTAFPGYKIARPIMEKAGDFQLSIPAIGLNTTVEVKPNAVGPYFQLTKYIPKAQSEALRHALSNPKEAVQVVGKIGADIPTLTTLEHVELGTETCSELLSGDASVKTLILNFAGLDRRIQEMSLKYPATAKALEESVLDGCLNLPGRVSVTSVKDLLKVKLQARSPFKPVGETQDIVPAMQTAPLYYDAALEIPGGGQ